MIPTAARCSKASRAPLTPKRGNKDFYKGTRQAFLPGGRRTGAPGVHVVRGKAKYRLVDEKVRVFVAPPITEIEDCQLRPYVALGTHLSPDAQRAVVSKMRAGGLTPAHFLRVAREHTYARRNPTAPVIPDALRAALAAAQHVTASPGRAVADAVAAAKADAKSGTAMKKKEGRVMPSERIRAAQERKEKEVPEAMREQRERALAAMEEMGTPNRSLLRVMRRAMPAMSAELEKNKEEEEKKAKEKMEMEKKAKEEGGLQAPTPTPSVPLQRPLLIGQPKSFVDLSFSSSSESSSTTSSSQRTSSPTSSPNTSSSTSPNSNSNQNQTDTTTPENTLSIPLTTPNLPAWLRAALALRAKDTPQARREAEAEEERVRAMREGGRREGTGTSREEKELRARAVREELEARARAGRAMMEARERERAVVEGAMREREARARPLEVVREHRGVREEV